MLSHGDLCLDRSPTHALESTMHQPTTYQPPPAQQLTVKVGGPGLQVHTFGFEIREAVCEFSAEIGCTSKVFSWEKFNTNHPSVVTGMAFESDFASV